MLKASFVFNYLNVFPDFFYNVGNRFDKKAKVNFKIYDIADWEPNNYNTYSPIFLRSKGKRTMKFDQSVKFNIRNIFLEKSYTKCGGEASPRPFYKKSKSSISLDHQSEML